MGRRVIRFALTLGVVASLAALAPGGGPAQSSWTLLAGRSSLHDGEEGAAVSVRWGRVWAGPWTQDVRLDVGADLGTAGEGFRAAVGVVPGRAAQGLP